MRRSESGKIDNMKSPTPNSHILHQICFFSQYQLFYMIQTSTYTRILFNIHTYICIHTMYILIYTCINILKIYNIYIYANIHIWYTLYFIYIYTKHKHRIYTYRHIICIHTYTYVYIHSYVHNTYIHMYTSCTYIYQLLQTYTNTHISCTYIYIWRKQNRKERLSIELAKISQELLLLLLLCVYLEPQHERKWLV